ATPSRSASSGAGSRRRPSRLGRGGGGRRRRPLLPPARCGSKWGMATTLTDAQKALLDEPHYATVTTVMPDGSPQTTVVWGDRVVGHARPPADGHAGGRRRRRRRRLGEAPALAAARLRDRRGPRLRGPAVPEARRRARAARPPDRGGPLERLPHHRGVGGGRQ